MQRKTVVEKRNVSSSSIANHGPCEPVSYLHSFRDAVVAGEIVDVRSSIPLGAIRVYYESRQAELVALTAEIG